jgi:hypothetical protein
MPKKRCDHRGVALAAIGSANDNFADMVIVHEVSLSCGWSMR